MRAPVKPFRASPEFNLSTSWQMRGSRQRRSAGEEGAWQRSTGDSQTFANMSSLSRHKLLGPVTLSSCRPSRPPLVQQSVHALQQKYHNQRMLILQRPSTRQSLPEQNNVQKIRKLHKISTMKETAGLPSSQRPFQSLNLAACTPWMLLTLHKLSEKMSVVSASKL